MTLSGVPVSFPVAGFQQATGDGEGALLTGVREAVGEANRSADLFAGLGTFALGVGASYAAEAARDLVWMMMGWKLDDPAAQVARHLGERGHDERLRHLQPGGRGLVLAPLPLGGAAPA